MGFDTRYSFRTFTFYDHTGIEKYLEKMALKGWMVEEIGSFGWKYHRIEPKKLHFAVLYYPIGNEYTRGLTKEQSAFRDLCEESGWNLAAYCKDMMIYYSEEEEPVPIETEAITQVDAIHEGMKKGVLKGQIGLFVVMLLNLIRFVLDVKNRPFETLSSNLNLYIGAVCLVASVTLIAEITGYFLWHRKAFKLAKEAGAFLPTKGLKFLRTLWISIIVVGFAWVVFSLESWKAALVYVGTFIVTLAVLSLGIHIVKKVKQGPGTLDDRISKAGISWFLIYVILWIILFFGISAGIDSSESKIEHKVDYDGYSYELEVSESPFLTSVVVDQDSYMEETDQFMFRCMMYKTKYEKIREICWEAMKGIYEDNELIMEDKSLWQAEEAYFEKSEFTDRWCYLILWEDRVMSIVFGFEPTEEQIQATVEKLRNY